MKGEDRIGSKDKQRNKKLHRTFIFWIINKTIYMCYMWLFGSRGLYFIFSPIFNKEITSWICIIGVIPFAGIGFFKYNGMNLEDFIITWIKSEILIPKKLKFVSEDMYYEMTKNIIENKAREEFNRNDKINQQFKETGKR